MKPRRSVIALALSAAAFLAVETSPSANAAPASADRTQWFREARFGLFIHWGVYAVPAGEWNGRKVSPTQGGEWISRLLSIPSADYRAFAPQFTASRYEPQAWAKLAREAGMKYVVVTAKHPDDFALYDSAASDWNAVKASAAVRDLLAPLAAAVRAEGLRFGAYYSQSQPRGRLSRLARSISPTAKPLSSSSPCERAGRADRASAASGLPRLNNPRFPFLS